MRKQLSTVITRVRTMEIEDVNHHIIASGYVVTALAFNGHSTLVMTAVYLWAGLAHSNALRATHLSTFVPHLRRRRPAAPAAPRRLQPAAV
ncbi:hypothetical protein JNUCC0626_49700 (plasmid) [Lentzea sp. JNUCC 0626]|uniref:hypothetical protein n=1 Tax=Lentzea sp. JNUCC 0626 TaxID=3367513 RepID=UPI003747C9B9